MSHAFLDIATTHSVRAAQEANGSAAHYANFKSKSARDTLGEAEAAFIAARDSFYMATVSETGWPYVQHRGGPRGFLRVLDGKTLAFADYRGNRQYISLGNVTANERACLILMDYANRARLKLFVRIEVKELAANPSLAGKLATPDYKAAPERAMILHVEAFDWNCPQHITPRYSEAELANVMAPMRQRIAELELENTRLRRQAAVA
jgi:predicted pyridoxine 5'-phosphate oxidase superfamily flavin-nucleotide-binding protein